MPKRRVIARIHLEKRGMHVEKKISLKAKEIVSFRLCQNNYATVLCVDRFERKLFGMVHCVQS